MPLKLVISDLDGTILETEDYHRGAYNALFEELDLTERWSKRDYSERLTQVGGSKIREIFRSLNRPEEEYADIKKRLYALKTELYTELIVADLMAGKLGLRPGVARLFAELAEQMIPISIASTCVKWAAIEVIRAAMGKEFLDSLATICAGNDVENMKPHPDVYLPAAAQCGIAPADCLVLEDTSHGLQSALAAGMICVVTPSELARKNYFNGAHLLSENLDTPERIDVARLRKLF